MYTGLFTAYTILHLPYALFVSDECNIYKSVTSQLKIGSPTSIKTQKKCQIDK